MRFRAVVSNDNHGVVHGVFAMLERLESGGKREKRKACVILSASGMSIAVIAGATDDMLAFADIRASTFKEFEVTSRAENQIYLIVPLEPLARCLGSAKAAAVAHVKLAKRRQACLCVEFEGTTVSHVSHQVPVRVVRQEDVGPHQPPDLPRPDLVLELPPSRLARTVVERLRAVGDRVKGNARYVDVKIEAKGRLSLKVHTEAAVIKTFFSDLALQNEEVPVDASVSLRVDSRKLAQSLQSYALPFTSIACCAVENTALVLHVILNNDQADLTFYIPAVDTGDDQMDDDEEEEDAPSL
ncbi:hypothetical protein CTAYLR_005964 [Chrysophaeum taylorii]|uniref:Checkpoint protein n=1 Tax=Chrysophaeum taylorii TaxID=2483200 RepID=A0AAD7UJ08_9STRA|nr:hypothetical protein CTAYLR_005964 [Chrysophaeum taylorii]